MVIIDSGESHSFATELVVKSFCCLVHSTAPISIHFAISSEVVLDLMCTVTTVFYDVCGPVST